MLKRKQTRLYTVDVEAGEMVVVSKLKKTDTELKLTPFSMDALNSSGAGD